MTRVQMDKLFVMKEKIKEKLNSFSVLCESAAGCSRSLMCLHLLIFRGCDVCVQRVVLVLLCSWGLSFKKDKKGNDPSGDFKKGRD